MSDRAGPGFNGRWADRLAADRIGPDPDMVQLDEADDIVVMAGFHDRLVPFDLVIIPEAEMVFAKASTGKHRGRLDTNEADPAFPLNASMIAQMASSVASITASRTVDEGAPADYGLDDPACTVTVEYGTERHIYKTGDYNSFSGSYYLMADGMICLVSQNLASTFSRSLDDLLVRDTIPSTEWASREYVNGVTVRDGDTERTVTDADEIEELLTALGRVSLYTCTDYAADDGERAACGLDGSRSVTVSYRKAVSTQDSEGNTTATNYLDTSYTLLFGDEVDAGVYCSPLSSTMIYTVSTDTAASLLSHAAETDSAP